LKDKGKIAFWKIFDTFFKTEKGGGRIFKIFFLINKESHFNSFE